MRLSLADALPSLLVPTRFAVFATVDLPVGRSKKTRPTGVAWDGWNDDPMMERRMARLRGAGSFYWPNALTAYRAARRTMREDARVSQIKIETISGREVGRIWR